MIHILLAAYNEELALPLVLNGVARSLADGNFKIWLVDDGSSDRTGVVAREWASRVPLTLLTHTHNRGLGAALRTGLEAVATRLLPNDVMVTLDADFTHPPELIARLVAPLEDGTADMAIASRFVPGAQIEGLSTFRRFTGFVASYLFRTLLPIPGVRDYTCGFRAYRGDFLNRVLVRWPQLITENGFAVQAEWLAKSSSERPRVVEIPLMLRYDRKPTTSKMPVLKTIVDTLRLIRRLKSHAGASFGDSRHL